MAVVFISPKQRQKMFITGITIVVGLFFIVIASIVFFSQPKEVAPELVFNKPKVNINFAVLDSDQFKSLQPFEEMKTEFSYKAIKDGEDKDGYISADSIEDATKILIELGYIITQIKESEIGRDNPFEFYKSITPTDLQNILENTQTTGTTK